ncbi:ZIP family metal transporter [Kordiimonas sp.]|uniref:ZIP family metal transporter n=1 Tax=Kordiimonas sp. TaxID=1970157 RepID=UPI003B529F38
MGYFLLYAFNRFVAGYVCSRPDYVSAGLGLVPMLGIGLHSFIDGMVYSVTFSVSIFTGSMATLGMILHEFPEGIVTYVLLRKGGFAERSALKWAFLAAALTTPAGMLLSFPFVTDIGKPLLGDCLALSAGALIYVGASYLLPEVERQSRRYSVAALGAGVYVALLIVLSGA